MTGMFMLCAEKINLSRDGVIVYLRDGGWGLEEKLNGYRVMMLNGKLYSRGGHDITAKFPEVMFKFDGVLDGELVALDGTWESVSKRNGMSRPDLNYPCQFRPFDILEHKGKDLRGAKLDYRKDLLVHFELDTPRYWFICPYIEDYDFLKKEGVEGIILKRKDSRYYPGRSHQWVKAKFKA